jgi:hypothetical protein
MMRRGFCLIPPVTGPKIDLAAIESVFVSRNRALVQSGPSFRTSLREVASLATKLN